MCAESLIPITNGCSADGGNACRMLLVHTLRRTCGVRRRAEGPLLNQYSYKDSIDGSRRFHEECAPRISTYEYRLLLVHVNQ